MGDEGFVWDWENQSIPLKGIGSGPPKFIGGSDKMNANEGETYYVNLQVEGNPPPEVVWFKGFKDLRTEQTGRYRMWTRGGDGEGNVVILGINQCRTDEEGDYKCVLKNEHGEETFDFKFYVTVEGGMDFRAMLMKRKKPQKKAPVVAVEWIETPVDLSVQEGKCETAVFAAKLSEKDKKGRWFLRNEETRKDKLSTEYGLELPKKDVNYEISQEGDCYSLTISHPKVEHSGRYTLVVKLDKDVKFTSASLDVAGADPEFFFVQKLDTEAKGFTSRPITLRCSVNRPGASVIWLKNGANILLSSGLYDRVDGKTEFALTIKSGSLNDSGLYSCVLQEFVKEGEEVESSCMLDVQEYPHSFTSQLMGQSVVENDECSFEIDVEDESADVKWFHNGTEILPGDPRVQIIVKGKKRKLVIKCAQLSDAGELSAKTNAQESKCTLTVAWENQIILGLPPYEEVVERNLASFPIEMRDPTAPIKIVVNGVQAPNDRLHLDPLGGGKYTLKVAKWEMADAGILELCTPSNRGAQLSTKCEIIVIKGEEKPMLGDCDPVTGIAHQDCSCSIPYSVEGHQQSRLEIAVFKDGRKLVIGRDIDLSMDGDQINLSVLNPTRDKSGVYRVVIKNAQGQSEKLINVNILDAPDSPGKPETLDWGPSFCDLSWKAPEEDGGSAILCYEIEMLEKLYGKWAFGQYVSVEDVTFLDGGKIRGTCQGLIEGCEYQFRIKAVNKIGVSKPSAASEPPIIAKTRFIKPFIRHPGMHDIEVKKGKPFCFDIWFGGEPAPAVKWMKGGRQIMSNENVSLELFIRNSIYCERNSVLRVAKSERMRDAGKYTVVLDSETGSEEASGFVNVLDVPKEPRNFKVTNIGPDKVSFSWQPPEDDGGRPIKYYQIRMMDFETGEWNIVADCTDLQGTVTGLRPGKCYEFEIVAVNREGESLATKIDEPVFTSERNGKPGPPMNLKVVDYDNNKMLLRWSKPKFDGGSSIQKYIVEKRDVSLGNWTKACEPKVLDCEKVDDFYFQYWVNKLVTGKTYEFRVYAVNKVCTSDPSESSDPETCRTKNSVPSIDQSLGGCRIRRENRRVDWKIPIVGYPLPQVFWTKNGDPLEAASHVRCFSKAIDDGEIIACLSVIKCKKSDAGQYVLTAKNSLGSASLNIDLIVLDDLDNCECTMFRRADLSCPCRHKQQLNLNLSAKQTLKLENGEAINFYVF